MSARPRVYLTGAGVVSPLGTGLADNLEGIRTGRRSTATIENFPTDTYPCRLGAEARDRDGVIRTAPGEDRKGIFLATAVREMLEGHAGWNATPPALRSLHLGTGIDHFDLEGLVDATGGGAASDWRDHLRRSHTIAHEVATTWDIGGERTVNVAACVASTQAIGLAMRQVRRRPLKAAVTGGCDSMLSPLHYMGFHKLGALSDWTGDPGRACRPFDRERCGIVLGEGASTYLVQSEETALPGTILAEIAGFASSMDAWLVTDPEPEGRRLAQAALAAIHDAGLAPEDIDCVHLHGTGTHKNDLAETAAMALVFDDRFRQIPVFSLKGQVGHLVGACGALEILGVIHSLRHQEIPVTVNSEVPDPAIQLFVQREAPLPRRIRHVLKLNAAFGGQNTALVLKAP